MVDNLQPGQSPALDSADDIFFEVTKVILKRFDGTDLLDLSPNWTNIQIIESITSPFITGSIAIVDAGNIFHDYFRGEEEIEIEFITRGFDDPIHLKFYVNNVSQFSVNKQQTSSTYALDLITKEAFYSKIYSIETKLNKRIGPFVQDIFESTLLPVSNRKIKVSQTSGIQDIIIPEMDLIETFQFLSKRAYSSTYKTSLYSFYESNKGFNFRNIEDLINEKRKDMQNKIYKHDPYLKTNEYSNEDAFYSLLKFEVSQVGDTLLDLGSGALYNNVVDFDLITKAITTNEYKSVGTVGIGERETRIHSDKFISKFSEKGPMSTIVKTIDSSKRPDRLTEAIGPRIDAIISLNKITATAEILGNSYLEAGDILNLKLIAPHSYDDIPKDPEHYKLAGNWLITRLEHNISDQDYRQNMILVKDGFNGKDIT